MASIIDDILSGAGKGKAEAPDLTSERIADAVELSAAIAALQFYDAEGSSAAAERLKRLVGEFTKRLCRRHGV